MVKKEVDKERFDWKVLEGIKIYYDKRFQKKRGRYKIDYSPSLNNIVVEEIWRR